MLKANIVDFVKVMIRFEPLGVWDFGFLRFWFENS